MSKLSQKPQNIFLIAEELQKTYKNFVKSFQKFQNPHIQQWVDQQMEKADLLYKDPLIELNYQFEKGKSLHDFVNEGHLDAQIPALFNIEPYKHQSEAIEKILVNDKNIIVSTGTGSGKSMCFWIPIVNMCLKLKEQGERGIKAILIYPMNALANSQYNMIVEILKGTDLKVGRYTGDTAPNHEEAKRLLEKNESREPHPCEVLSREEMRESPPDILITNYVMLDLILTRFDDRALFPPRFQKNLKYLVLDEIHTHSGNKGADVACLIRRLKEKTNTKGELKCIGTSATIQDTSITTGVSSIVNFAQKIFGENFDNDCLIEATHVNLTSSTGAILSLPSSIQVEENNIHAFDGTFGSIIPIAEQLLGRNLTPTERNPLNLGQIFINHPTIIFIREELKEKAKNTKILAEDYQKAFRVSETLQDCLKELNAAFLVGTVAKLIHIGEERPLLVPKLHVFFTQGQEISSCLTKNEPHLHVKGEVLCSKCETFRNFPLKFCRNCGHEFYKVTLIDNEAFAGNEENEETGEIVYLTPVSKSNNSWEIPEQWLQKNGKIKKTYENSVPDKASFCPRCNKIESTCTCPENLEVWKIPFPLQLCPSCEVFYTKQSNEFGKLFSFNSIGRSSATDVLVSKQLSQLDESQKKVIIFTDNRQDTALQSEHLNEFQRRLNFRRIFLHAMHYIHQKNLRVSDKEIGNIIYEYLEKSKLVPEYDKNKEDPFSTAPPPIKEFKEFLTYLALSDITRSTYFLDLTLEKLGLLKIEYDGLDILADHQKILQSSDFQTITSAQRYDYLRGILDMFRWRGAINHPIFTNSLQNYEEWEKVIKKDLIFDISNKRYSIVGFVFDKPGDNRRYYYNRQRIYFQSISGTNSMLMNWTKKFFNLDDTNRSKKIVEFTIKTLEQAKFLGPFYTENPTFKLYQINEGKMLFQMNLEETYHQCPKCRRTYNFKEYDSCIWRTCPKINTYPIAENSYFYDLYNQKSKKYLEVHAKEHSAQISGSMRAEFEHSFKKEDPGTLNVLVCTPTMELGIDIGDLSAIMMRNVPPDPSHYAQRAGRAGRKNQPSIISVFCGSGYAKGPHDQYFYREPEQIVSGKIITPSFLLDNKKLIRRQIHALILESLTYRLPSRIGEILELGDTNQEYPLKSNLKTQLSNLIHSNIDELVKIIENVFSMEISRFDWFDTEFIKNTINAFMDLFSFTFEMFREEYAELDVEREFLNDQLALRSNNQDARKRNAIERKLEQMRSGKDIYYTYTFLSNYGFLPNYSFPGAAALLTMYDKKRGKFSDNWRSSVIAIREFAPHNNIYFLGSKFKVNKAVVKTEQGEIDINTLYICSQCNEIQKSSTTSSTTNLVNCPSCGEQMQLSDFKQSFQFPHMSSISGARITCDEESRQIRGYEISLNYKHDLRKIRNFEIVCDGSPEPFGELTYEHNGTIFLVNKGTRVKSDRTHEINIEPFSFCSACGDWLFKGAVDTHPDKCPRKGNVDNLITPLWLFVEGNHDVITFNLPIIGKVEENEIDSYYTTLKETIIQSIMLTFNIEDSEIDAFLNPIPGQKEMSIVVFETDEGGIGILKSLTDANLDRYSKFIENLLEIIHIESITPFKEQMGACQTACYNCLLRFRNQFEHKYMNRKLIVTLVKTINKCKLKYKETDTGSTEEILTKLKSKCDSELEKKVLDEMVNQGLKLPDNGQEIIYEGAEAITKTDFFYKPDICIFVDGPPHAHQNVRDDDVRKRERIESLGYTVIELDFRDGEYSKIPDEVKKLKRYFD